MCLCTAPDECANGGLLSGELADHSRSAQSSCSRHKNHKKSPLKYISDDSLSGKQVIGRINQCEIGRHGWRLAKPFSTRCVLKGSEGLKIHKHLLRLRASKKR